MKVVFVLPSFHTNMFYALRALVAAGVEPVLVVRRASQAQLDGVRIIRPGADGLSLRSAGELLRREAPDLVVVRRTPGISRRIFLAALAQRRKIVSYDQQPYLMPAGWRSLTGRLTSPFRTPRFTPVHGLPDALGAPDPAASYLPFPVESLEQGARRVWAPGGRTRIICVAKLGQPRKNHFVLIEALEQLADRFDFSLTFVGITIDAKGFDDSYLSRLRNYPEQGPIGERVSVLEEVPFDAMRGLYLEHDLCVLPSHDEPLGTAPLEAMGMGCAAIVTTECGSAGYLLGAERAGKPCGHIVEAGDRAALAGLLETILKDRHLLETYGRNALAWTREEFCEPVFARRFRNMAARAGVKRP